MKNTRAVILIGSLIMGCISSYAQKNVTTFGLMVRPGFPNQFLGASADEFNDSTIFYKINLFVFIHHIYRNHRYACHQCI